MERPAYNNFPKNRNGPGYGGQNQEFRDASRRIFCKLRGQRYLNPSNEWLAKFIQEKLFTFDYEETAAWYAETARKLSPSTGDLALLGCNDRYFLLTVLLGRQELSSGAVPPGRPQTLAYLPVATTLTATLP